MGDYSDGHDDPNGLRDLKCQTDPDAVHKAVSRQREGRKDAYLRVMMSGVVGFMNIMDQYEFLDTVKEQKPDNERNHCAGGVDPLLVGQVKNLGQDVKTDDAQKPVKSDPLFASQLALSFGDETGLA